VDGVAAALALLAAAFFALAATLWQRATLNLSEVSLRHPATFVALFIQWVWLLGLAAQGIGVLLQGGALDHGRLASSSRCSSPRSSSPCPSATS
jgi:hypothetical protein